MGLNNLKSWGGIFIILVIGLLLRLYKLDAHGIWYDEIMTLRTASGIGDIDYYVAHCYSLDSLHNIELETDRAVLNKHPFTSADFEKNNTLHNLVNAVILDNSNNLSYDFCIHYWSKLFGYTDFSCRMLSVLASLLIIFSGWYYGRKLLGSEISGFALAFLLAINPLLILDSNWIRPYTLTTFFGFIATLLFLEIVFFKKRGLFYFFYACACLISIFGHHMIIYLYVAHALIALLYLRDTYSWKVLSAIAAIVLLAFGLWYFKYGAMGFKIMAWKNANDLKRALAHGQVINWGQLLPYKIISVSVLHYLNIIMGFDYLVLLKQQYDILLFFILLLPVPIIYFYASDTRTKRIMISLLLIIICAPLYATFIFINSKNLVAYNSFYICFAVPFGAFLLILCASRINFLPGRLKVLAVILAFCQLTVIAISIPGAYVQASQFNQIPNPYNKLANDIKSSYRNNDVVVYPNWHFAQLVNFYLKDRSDIIQDVDTTLVGKVELKRNGNYTELMDINTLSKYK